MLLSGNRPRNLSPVIFGRRSCGTQTSMATPPLRLGDFVFHDVDCLTPKGSGYGPPNSDGSRTRWTWKGATFARDDVLSLWRDWDCFAAWKQAKAQIWKPPRGLSPEWLNNLPPGQYTQITDVVSLLAFGLDPAPITSNRITENAARFRTGLALIVAARDAKVTLRGRASYGRPLLPDGMMAVTGLMKIEPEFLVDTTLVIDG